VSWRDKAAAFVGEHFALVVAGVLVAIFVPMAFIGPPPPPPPPVLVTLSPEDRRQLARDIVREVMRTDAGRDAR